MLSLSFESEFEPPLAVPAIRLGMEQLTELGLTGTQSQNIVFETLI